MGLLQKVGAFLRDAPAMLRPRFGGRRALGQFMSSGSSYGPWLHAWTDSRYEMVRHYKHWVYIAIDKIATSIAMHPPNISYCRKHGSYDPDKILSLRSRSKALVPLQAHEQLEPVPGNHPLARLLQDPNEPDTAFDLWYETVMYLLLTGNSYWWLPPGAFGKPAAIWVLPAHWIYPRANKQGMIDCYDLRPVEGNYIRATIPAEDVIHFKKKSPVSKIDGYSPQMAGSQWIDTQESIDRSRWFSFRNGIFPGVSVEFDAGIKLPNEDDLNRIESRLMQRYGGEINTNKPIMVPPGASLKKIQLNPDEMKYIESSEQLAANILSLFGVPKLLAQIPDTVSSGAVLAAQTGFFMQTLNPLWRFFGMHLTEKLAVPRYDKNLKIWWEDRTPEDPDLLERQLNTDLAYGARTMNEVRSLRGLEPYREEWGNVPWIPLNTRPITEVIQKAEKEEVLPDNEPGSQGTNLATQSSPGNTPQGGIAPDQR